MKPDICAECMWNFQYITMLLLEKVHYFGVVGKIHAGDIHINMSDDI